MTGIFYMWFTKFQWEAGLQAPFAMANKCPECGEHGLMMATRYKIEGSVSTPEIDAALKRSMEKPE